MDATKVDLSGSDLDNVSSVDRPLDMQQNDGRCALEHV